MKKLINNIINFFLRLLYLLRIGKIEHLPFGELIWVEKFASLEHWHVTTQGNWGAVYPDSITCASPDNVELVEEGVRLYTHKNPQGIVGCDFEGNKKRCYYSHAEIFTLNYLKYGWFEAEIQFDKSGRGCWDAFWVNSPGETGQHLEVDFFENKRRMEVTTHNHKKKKQYKFTYPKLTGRHTVVGHIEPGRTTIYLDGYKIFSTKIHMPNESDALILRFTSGLDGVENDLPYYFTINKFKYYDNQ